MRLEVTIPDPIFDQAQRAATASGVSIDRFLSEAVRFWFDDEPRGPIATPELIAALRKAEADIDAGKGLTMAQLDESLAAKRAAWLKANPC